MLAYDNGRQTEHHLGCCDDGVKDMLHRWNRSNSKFRKIVNNKTEGYLGPSYLWSVTSGSRWTIGDGWLHHVTILDIGPSLERLNDYFDARTRSNSFGFLNGACYCYSHVTNLCRIPVEHSGSGSCYTGDTLT